MKYLILSAAIFCAVPSNAQKLLIGLNAGAALSGNFEKVESYHYGDKFMKNNVDPLANIRIGTRRKATEYGCLFSVSRFSQLVDRRFVVPYRTNDYFIGRDPRPYDGHTPYNLAELSLSVQFYLNQHFSLGKLDMYAGFAMGPGIFYVENTFVESKLDKYPPTGNVHRTGVTTMTTTIMCGMNYKVDNNLSINLEATGNYVIPHNAMSNASMHLYTIPVTLGMRYRILR